MIKYDIKATGLDLTSSIKKHVGKKIAHLEKLVDQLDESAYAQVEVERTTDHHQKGDVFRAEINLHTAGKNLRAESTTEDLLVSLDEVKEEMSREFIKSKGRRETMFRKGARKFKKIIQRLK